MLLSPNIQKVEGFIVSGFSVRTQNTDEFDERTAKIPGLWQEFYTSEFATSTPIFGVYSNYDSDADGHYTVTVGIKSPYARPGLSSIAIQTGNYLIFQGTGPMPNAVVETWGRIWAFFEKNKEYRRNFVSDFEAYSGSDQVMIYIGLE